jgi:hypothetical protein
MDYEQKYKEALGWMRDLHQVLRHQLWLDRPEDKKSPITVDADEAMQFGTEPLAKIENNNHKTEPK